MTSPRSARGQARRSAILQIARTVLLAEGLDRFALRHIAQQSGIKLGNLQYYFATRDDLLEAVIRSEFDRDLATVRTAVEDRDELPRTLADMSRRLVESWCTGGSDVFIVLALLAGHNERFARLKAEIYATFYAELGDLMHRIDPGIDDEEATARTLLVTSLLDGAALQLHAAPDDDFAGCDEFLSRTTTMVEGIARGIATEPVRSSPR